jgi:hypothetical protein
VNFAVVRAVAEPSWPVQLDLCTRQCDFWHCFEQYDAAWHREHRFAASAAPHDRQQFIVDEQPFPLVVMKSDHDRKIPYRKTIKLCRKNLGIYNTQMAPRRPLRQIYIYIQGCCLSGTHCSFPNKISAVAKRFIKSLDDLLQVYYIHIYDIQTRYYALVIVL